MNYSIIIPHRNCIKLLQRCLDSIPDREDLEIIVVDDNSVLTNEERKCFPGIDRPRTRVFFTTDGLGAGYARNVGLKYATGKYLLFVDADDFLPVGITAVLDELVDLEDDVVFFKHSSVSSDDVSIQMNRCDELNSFVDDYLSDCNRNKNEYQLRCKWCVPWAKLIKKDLVKENNIRFSEVRYANDIYFSIQSGILANSIRVAEKEAYVVTVREKSLSYNFCGTSEELRVRLGEALKTDRFVKKSGIIRPNGERSESDELLWCIYYNKGGRYLWRSCYDGFYSIRVFCALFWFLLKRKMKG